MAGRVPQFNRELLYDTTPLPDSIPKVKELGASSAPLLSASFFIGARCKDYNDDFMKCKTDKPGRGQFECLQEGRRVTRCARSVYVANYLGIADINTHCLEQFKQHWECLDNNNQQLWQCRPDEWRLNKCVFTNLGLEKTIPDAAGVPVHERPQQIFAHSRFANVPKSKQHEPETISKEPAPAS